MPKNKQKKVDKILDKCFISKRVKLDKAIRDSCYRNEKFIGTLNVKEIHQNILKAMNIKSEHDSRYFILNSFHALIQEVKVLTKKEPDDEKFDLI